MSVSVPPGRRHELELSERLADIGTEVDTIRDTLPSVNDPDLHRRVAALADLAAELVAVHTQPGPDLAEALAGLLSATRALRVPARDPELGRTPTLDGLRAVQGRLVMAVTDALDAAQALGLRPRHLPAIQEQAVDIPRAGNEALLRGIVDRLDDVATRLRALDAARAEPTIFVQQTGLLTVYLRAMQVEIDLARLQLTIGDTTVDFGALSRAAEAMAGLTSDFVATVRAWIGRVSDAVARSARELPGRVRKVATGIRTAARWIVRRARRAKTSPQTETFHTPGSEVEDERLSDFAMREVRRLILADQPVPAGWIPFITELNMTNSGLADLRRLAALTNLQILYLTGTQVSDVAPLAALTNLQSLNLWGTQVSDVAALRHLTGLRIEGAPNGSRSPQRPIRRR
jgi:Leucine Rich repeats (2 copies)